MADSSQDDIFCHRWSDHKYTEKEESGFCGLVPKEIATDQHKENQRTDGEFPNAGTDSPH